MSDSNLPAVGAADMEEIVSIPQGMDAKAWTSTVKKARGMIGKAEDKTTKYHRELLPVYLDLGEELVALLGNPMDTCKGSPVGMFAEASGIARPQLQRYMAFHRTFNNDAMKVLIAEELGLPLNNVDGKAVCGFIADAGICVSAIWELIGLAKPKMVLEFIKQARDNHWTVDKLRTEIRLITKGNPELLTNASARSHAREEKSAENKRDAGEKGGGKSTKTPAGACKLVTSKVEAYLEAAGCLAEHFTVAEAYEGVGDAKKLLEDVTATVEELEQLLTNAKSNISMLKQVQKVLGKKK
jgi:hypothetical protein